MADGKKRKGARKGRLEDLITPFREPQTRIPAVAFVASTAGLALLFSERNALSPWPIFWAIPVLALFSLAYMSNFSQNLSLVCCVILEMRIRDVRFSIIPNYPQGHSIDWLIAVVTAIQAGSFYRLHRLNELVQQNVKSEQRRTDGLPLEFGAMLILLFVGIIGAQYLQVAPLGIELFISYFNLPPVIGVAVSILWATCFLILVGRLLLFAIKPRPTVLEANVYLNDAIWQDLRGECDRFTSVLAKHHDAAAKKSTQKKVSP